MRHFLMLQLSALLLLAALPHGQASADVTQTADDGFLIEIEREVDLAPGPAYEQMVSDFAKWWNGEHSFGGDAENLSLDLNRRCMLETLPDGGFVRHLEITAHMPGKMMILRGGLGPLQPMGVNGALVMQFRPLESGKTMIALRYSVHGPSYQNLTAFAKPVDGVLTEQMDRLQKHLASAGQ